MMQIKLNNQGFLESFAYVGNLIDAIEVSEGKFNTIDIEKFEFYKYDIASEKFTFNQEKYTEYRKEKNYQEKLYNLRALREVFFNRISDKQSKWQNILRKQPQEQQELLKEQYYNWYEKWLEITLTMQIPTPPEWLQPLFHKEVESRAEYQQILETINNLN